MKDGTFYQDALRSEIVKKVNGRPLKGSHKAVLQIFLIIR